MGFSYFVLEVLLRITEMFIHVKTSENWFYSIVKGFRANFDYRRAHFCLFEAIDCCNPLAFPKESLGFPSRYEFT